MSINSLIRKNIVNLKPYSSARSEFTGDAAVFIDANENPFNNKLGRYPDPLQRNLKEKIARIKNVSPEQIFLGNGSDEPIDLVFRIFCEPGIDNVVSIDPTYGMYQVAADINAVDYIKVPLNDDFSLNADRILAAINSFTKIVFICSPNNPTANSFTKDEILKILNHFNGIVVLDEAYIDFSSQPSLISLLNNYPNLIVLQTFSKAWGLASVRLGMAFACNEIINVFNKVKYPYNINLLTQEFVENELTDFSKVNNWVKTIIKERDFLIQELNKIKCIQLIYPSDANFVLAKVSDANDMYMYLVKQKIIVRNRNNITLCNNCLRITVGTHTENTQLLAALMNYKA